VEPGGFKKEDHITGDWGGSRERLFASGVEVFGFYNSILNGNISGGTHPRHATYVDDAWLGFKFDLKKLARWKGGLFGVSGINGIDGDIRNVLFDTRFSAYPFAVWAAALLYDPTPEINLKLGVFQTSDDMFENDDNGLNWGIESSDGYTAIVQVGWSPQFFKKAVYASLLTARILRRATARLRRRS